MLYVSSAMEMVCVAVFATIPEIVLGVGVARAESDIASPEA
jgi:hypothetical protein